ncbi:hypothetical protein WJS89_02010 [Sphingomicrobium sp. XHP0235]|uniref:hypothetical protein n=1 Tax=Sphingomicrobium aquimarinum TaxID=3133971 RepID=UPI0031FE62FF
MKTTLTAIALALASTALVAPAPVAAQEQGKGLEISKEARESLVALQTAAQEQNWAAVPGLAQAAKAKAKKPDDYYFIGNFMVQAGQTTDNLDLTVQGIDTMATSGYASGTDYAEQYLSAGKLYYNDNQYANARTWFQKAYDLDSTNGEPLVLIGETYNSEENFAEALGFMKRGIELEKANGQPVDENWYKRAISIGYKNQLVGVAPVSLMWINDNPSPETWRNGLRVLEAVMTDSGTLKDTELLDIWRLMRATGAMESERDYGFYADELIRGGYPGEALAVLNEGIEAGVVDANKVTFKELVAATKKAAAGDKAEVTAGIPSARNAAEARAAVATANALYGYDDFAGAADLYRAALGKTGVDANLVNLRLGMSLARAGDHAGAVAALDQVSGKFETVANYWKAWSALQS